MTDTRGLDAWFNQYFPRLVGLGAAMCGGDVEAARDAAQETFLRAHREWDRIGNSDAPYAWLRTVMTRLIIDRHRKRSNERVAVQRSAAAGRPNSYDAVVSAEAWHHLVGPLPARQRAIVTLFYADDLSIADIAAALDITEGAVKSALSKARRSIEAREDRHE